MQSEIVVYLNRDSDRGGQLGCCCAGLEEYLHDFTVQIIHQELNSLVVINIGLAGNISSQSDDLYFLSPFSPLNRVECVHVPAVLVHVAHAVSSAVHEELVQDVDLKI